MDKHTANVVFLCIVQHGSVIDCGGVAAFCALLPEALERGATHLNTAYGCSLGGACLTRLLAAMRMPIMECGELLCCHFCVRTQSVDFLCTIQEQNHDICIIDKFCICGIMTASEKI